MGPVSHLGFNAVVTLIEEVWQGVFTPPTIVALQRNEVGGLERPGSQMGDLGINGPVD